MKIDAAVVKGRSELGRQLTMERYYDRGYRRVWVAYFWFLMLGGFAAHRFYLRKWKSGVALLLLMWLPAITLIVLTPEVDPQLVGYLPAMYLLIAIVEIISIPFLTTSANKDLRAKLLRDFQLECR